MTFDERIREIIEKLVLPLYHEDRSLVRYCPECLKGIDQAIKEIKKAVEQYYIDRKEYEKLEDSFEECRGHCHY